MYRTRSGLILVFHGCDQSVLKKILSGEDLKVSRNKYDWLGHGIYFWDNSPERAFEDATFLKNNSIRSKTPISTPAVIGAVINLGICLDLLDYSNLKLLQFSNTVLESYNKPGYVLPKNRNVGNNEDLLLRERDCLVVEMLHEIINKNNLPAYDSVRGVFWKVRRYTKQPGFVKKIISRYAFETLTVLKGILCQERLMINLE